MNIYYINSKLLKLLIEMNKKQLYFKLKKLKQNMID